MHHTRKIPEKNIIRDDEYEEDANDNNDDEYNRTKDNDNDDDEDNIVNTDKERPNKEGCNNTHQYSQRTREEVINDTFILKQQMGYCDFGKEDDDDDSNNDKYNKIEAAEYYVGRKINDHAYNGDGEDQNKSNQ